MASRRPIFFRKMQSQAIFPGVRLLWPFTDARFLFWFPCFGIGGTYAIAMTSEVLAADSSGNGGERAMWSAFWASSMGTRAGARRPRLLVKSSIAQSFRDSWYVHTP